MQHGQLRVSFWPIVHEIKTCQKMTTLYTQICRLHISGKIDIKRIGGALSSHICGVQGCGYTGPNIGISYGIHVVRGCRVIEAVCPAPALSKVQSFHFSPCFCHCHMLLGMYTSDHVTLVHVQSWKSWCVGIDTLKVCRWNPNMEWSVCNMYALQTAVWMNGDRPA